MQRKAAVMDGKAAKFDGAVDPGSDTFGMRASSTSLRERFWLRRRVND